MSKFPNININEIIVVGSWNWSTNQKDLCGICRGSLLESCIECSTDETKCLECNINWGICRHVFHKCCINTWTRSSMHCPICKKIWEVESEDCPHNSCKN